MENKYIVRVPNIFAHTIEVDANNEEEAKIKVKEMLIDSNNKTEHPLTYQVTLPEDHWQVITKEEFDKLQDTTEQENPESNKL